MAGGAAADSPFQVLVVDDDPAICALLTLEATAAGHPVRSTSDGPTALAAMAERPAAIVISDIVLPGTFDGVQLCRSLKESHPDTEVVLISGQASIATAIEGVRMGACDYLLKPVEPEAIQRALARASGRIAQRLAERQVVAGLRSRTGGQAALLDRLSLPVLIVDGDARVLGRNQAAELLLAESGALVLGTDGRIRATNGAKTKELHAALASCCASPPIDAAPVSLPRGEDRPARAVVAPLTALGRSEGAPLAALLVDLPERSTVAPHAELLCRVYGLTQTEAQLAARLVSGESLQEVCEMMGIAVTTGRTHLSRIFNKTGSSRQADLVGLVLSGPAMFGGARPDPERR